MTPTIYMPKEQFQAWLDALRSGKYKQGREFLQTGDKYCCLGVLQQIISGECERDRNGDFAEVPSLQWLSDSKIYFYSKDGISPAPLLMSRGCSIGADLANDYGHSFIEIADALEQAYGGEVPK